MATEGIERNVTRDVDGLDNSRLVTLTRREARTLFDSNGESEAAEAVENALDWAQGDDNPAGRYVVIYVEPGDL